MTITSTIFGDKDGMIAHLRERQEQYAGAAKSARLQRDRLMAAGAVEGLDFAIRALEAWAIGEKVPVT